MMLKEKSKLTEALEAFERDYIINIMQSLGWSRKKTANELGIPLSTLKYKMTKITLIPAVGIPPKRPLMFCKSLPG